MLGLEVDPVFRDAATGEPFPLVRRALHKGISRAIKRTVFEFTRRQTSHRPPHYQALGRQSLVKAVWAIDRDLAHISNAFDFLLQVTPVNVDEAWAGFRRGRFDVEPEFSSRPLKLDPSLEKRKLFQIPIERIADPTLAQLFRDQQTEIDRKLTMLGDRGTPRFLYGSLQVFGGVDAPLLALAYEILNRVPPRSRDESLRGAVNAKAIRSARRRGTRILPGSASRYPKPGRGTQRCYGADGISRKSAGFGEYEDSGIARGRAARSRNWHAHRHLRQRSRTTLPPTFGWTPGLRRDAGGPGRSLGVPGRRPESTPTAVAGSAGRRRASDDLGCQFRRGVPRARSGARFRPAHGVYHHHARYFAAVVSRRMRSTSGAS